MGCKSQSTADQEQREIEWIRDHPRVALAHVREHAKLTKKLAAERQCNKQVGKNLDRAWSLHEELQTRLEALEAENAELREQLDFCKRKLGG